MTRSLPTLAVALVLLSVAGCSGDPGTPVTAPNLTASAPAPTSAGPAATTPAAGDQYAQQACKANTEAQKAVKSDDPEVMRPIAEAAQQSSVQAIATAGRLLSRQVDRAQAAKGASDEVAMAASLAAGSFEFTTACANAGLVF